MRLQSLNKNGAIVRRLCVKQKKGRHQHRTLDLEKLENLYLSSRIYLGHFRTIHINQSFFNYNYSLILSCMQTCITHQPVRQTRSAPSLISSCIMIWRLGWVLIRLFTTSAAFTAAGQRLQPWKRVKKAWGSESRLNSTPPQHNADKWLAQSFVYVFHWFIYTSPFIMRSNLCSSSRSVFFGWWWPGVFASSPKSEEGCEILLFAKKKGVSCLRSAILWSWKKLPLYLSSLELRHRLNTDSEEWITRNIPFGKNCIYFLYYSPHHWHKLQDPFKLRLSLLSP